MIYTPHHIYYPYHQINKNEIGGVRSTCRVRTGEYGVLKGKPERKRPLGRPRREWAENIKHGSSGSGMGEGGHRLD